MRVKLLLIGVILLLFSCASSPKSLSEQYTIKPIISDRQILRIEKGIEFIDDMENDIKASVNCNFKEREKYNQYTMFPGSLYSFLFTVYNRGHSINIYENDFSLYGRNNTGDEWKSIKVYTANESMQLMVSAGKIIYPGSSRHQDNHKYTTEEYCKKALLFSQTVSKDKAYIGYVYADFAYYNFIKFVYNIKSSDEKDIEFIFQIQKK